MVSKYRNKKSLVYRYTQACVRIHIQSVAQRDGIIVARQYLYSEGRNLANITVKRHLNWKHLNHFCTSYHSYWCKFIIHYSPLNARHLLVIIFQRDLIERFISILGRMLLLYKTINCYSVVLKSHSLGRLLYIQTNWVPFETQEKMSLIKQD